MELVCRINVKVGLKGAVAFFRKDASLIFFRETHQDISQSSTEETIPRYFNMHAAWLQPDNGSPAPRVPFPSVS